MQRDELVTYLDGLLRVQEISDPSQNGLQVEGAAEVETVAFTVDASQAAFEAAAAAGAQMLVVHHGLFWGQSLLVRGVHARRLRALWGVDMSLYAAHLPLDMHPTLGNNAGLADILDLQDRVPFGLHQGVTIGVGGRLPLARPLAQVAASLEPSLGQPLATWPFGLGLVRRVAICSGRAPDLLFEAAESGYDLFLSGETSHQAFHQARERAIHVIFGGHYRTETVGPKLLMEHLRGRFQVRTAWLDLPTGL
ncbi:MAG: Nif3-like dinuclear metal center hexameric protein [Chloroflexi bacterium]|nr:Nif3-like dinuclear metal center hexameric protein [Chloroflexota bacterium]